MRIVLRRVLFDALTATRSDFLRTTHAAQSIDRSPSNVNGVRCSDYLRQDVTDTDRIKDCAHRAAGNHAGAFRSRADNDSCGTVAPHLCTRVLDIECWLAARD